MRSASQTFECMHNTLSHRVRARVRCLAEPHPYHSGSLARLAMLGLRVTCLPRLRLRRVTCLLHDHMRTHVVLYLQPIMHGETPLLVCKS
jgi:hypothetical protein